MPTGGSASCNCPICGGGSAEPQYAGDGSGGLSGTKPVWSLQQIVSNLARWDARWGPGPVPYTFYSATPAHLAAKSDWNGFASFTSQQQEAARLAFSLISDVAGIQFVERADDGSQPGLANPRLTFSTSLSTAQYFTGYALVDITDGLDLGDAHRISSGELMFNGQRWNGSMAPGLRPFSVLMHEIMHGLGLSHPGAYNRTADEEITFGKHAEYAQDSAQFTVMSYFGAGATGSLHAGFANTPMLHDVAALQSLYGANTSTRAGDTVYGYGSTAGRQSYDFALNPTPIFTIWDGGGTDTLDFSQTTFAVNLNLNAGAFSDAFQMTNNISIAFGVVVENARGGSAGDYMVGNAAANLLEGGGGDDSLWGADGADRLMGGDGADTLVGQAGDDQLWGGAGADKVFGWSGADLMVGEGGDDELWAGEDNDVVYGWSGADRLVGEGGDDQLWGGEDGDAAYGFSGDDLLAGESGDDQLWGGEGNDRAYGGDGADVLVGEAGDDGLWGGEGGDTLWGRSGRDTLVGEAGDDRLWGEEEDDVLHGEAGDDIVSGGSGEDRLWGGADRDALYGGSGADQLSGEAGDDQLWGGEDRDLLFGGSGVDILVGEAGNDELWGGEDRDFLYGWSGSDVLVGEGGADELWGGEDSDFLYGWAGDDLLVGETGDDELWGGEGRDVLHGSAGTDLLVGEAGDDDLRGDDGNDRLVGGAGADRLQGGAGADTFVFQDIGHSGPGAADRILDFGAGDIIDLSGIDADAGLAGDQAFSLVGAFSNRAGQAVLSFDAASNTSALNLDLDGDGRSDFTLLFDGQVTAQGWLF